MKHLLLFILFLLIYNPSIAQEKELTPAQIKAKERFEAAKQHFLNDEHEHVINYYDSILKKYAYTDLETYKMANESYSKLALINTEDSEAYVNLAEGAYNQALKWFGKMQVEEKWDSLKIEVNQKANLTNTSYTKPDFPGGMTAFYKYIRKELKYPQEAVEMGIEGRVHVTFIVNKDGSIDAINALNAVRGGCTEEAIRVISNASNFIPGKRDGKPVYIRIRIPVLFSLVDEVSEESKSEKRRKRRKKKRG